MGSFLSATGRDLTAPLRPAPYVTCVRGADRFLQRVAPPGGGAPSMRRPDCKTSHGAAGRGAHARGVRASASWGLGVADAGRRGAAGGQRSADGGSRGCRGGRRGRRRAMGTAGGARRAQARVQPLQVSVGPGAAAPSVGQADSARLPLQEVFHPGP